MVKTYKYLSERERVQQHFNKDEIFLEKCGKRYNVYQAIQEAREDTEIIPTLLKYGCIDRLGVDKEKVYGDITQIQEDYRNVFEQQKQAQNLWESLPAEYRAKYNNSISEFLDKAPSDLKKDLEASKPVEQPVKQTESEVTNEPQH